MMVDARLTSRGFEGAGVDLRGGDMTDGFGLLISIDCLGLGAADVEEAEGFTWNASSANLSATRWDRSFGCSGELAKPSSNSNFWPLS
jgi:hypothetical protein